MTDEFTSFGIPPSDLLATLDEQELPSGPTAVVEDAEDESSITRGGSTTHEKYESQDSCTVVRCPATGDNSDQKILEGREQCCTAVSSVTPFDFDGEAGMVLDLLKVSCELPGLERAYKTVVAEITAFNDVVKVYNTVVAGLNWSPDEVALLEPSTGITQLESVATILPDLQRLLGSLGSVLVEMDCLDLSNSTSPVTNAAYSKDASRQSRRELIAIIETFLCPYAEKMLKHAKRAEELLAAVFRDLRKSTRTAAANAEITGCEATALDAACVSPAQERLAMAQDSSSEWDVSANISSRRRGREDDSILLAAAAAIASGDPSTASFDTLPDVQEDNDDTGGNIGQTASTADSTKSKESRRRAGGRWKRSKKKDPPVDWSARVREKIEQYKDHTRAGGTSTNFFNVPPDLKTQLRLLADCELQLKGGDESGPLPPSSRSVSDLKVIIETYIAALELAYKYLNQLRVNTAQLQLLYSHTIILDDLQAAEDLLPNLSFIISFLKTFETF